MKSIVAATLLSATLALMGGCGPENLEAWEYDINVVNGHTVLHAEGFDLWFEGKTRNTRSRGQLLVAGLSSTKPKKTGQGDGEFSHHFDGSDLIMSMFGETFKVSNENGLTFTLHIGGESFEVGKGDLKKTIIYGSGGTVRIGDATQLKEIKLDEPADGKKDGSKDKPKLDLNKPL